MQRLLDRRFATKARKVKHEFTLSGLVQCGHCGCLMVGEIKKGRYIYYHCTGNKGRCGEPYTREEHLADRMAHHLQNLVIAPATIAWLEQAAIEMDTSEQSTTEQLSRRLKADYDRLQQRIETMYLDRLDGRIDAAFFDRATAEWRREQRQIQSRMEQMKTAGVRSYAEAVASMRSVSEAAAKFLEAPAANQRKLLQTLVKAASWQGGELRMVLAEPYATLAHLNSASETKERENRGSGCDLGIWLPERNPLPQGKMRISPARVRAAGYKGLSDQHIRSRRELKPFRS